METRSELKMQNSSAGAAKVRTLESHSTRRSSRMSFRQIRFVLMLLAIFLATPLAGAEVSVEATRIGDATHIEFKGASEWKYVMKRDESGKAVVLRLNGLKPDSLAKLRGLNDGLIKSVQVNDKAIDESAEISFQISPQTDFFDYITDQPSRLIVDFFPKDEPAAPAKSAAKATPKVEEKAKPTQLPAKTAKAQKPADDSDEEGDDKSDVEPLRKPAGTDIVLTTKGELPALPSVAERVSSKKDFNHGIFDGGDPEFRRFTMKDYEVKDEAIVASRANFFLPFPMLELGVPQLKTLMTAAPTYEIVADDTQENKEARVILQLFSGKQRALFLKTAEEFVTKYTDSKYDEIVRYMIADSHYDIWRGSASVQDFETAMNHYLALTEKYPESPMTPRTHLLMGYSYLDRGDSFGALKVFQRFMRQSPNSKQVDRVQSSIAESYLKLNRFEEAFALFDQIEKTGKSQKGREEAAYRKGDVLFRKKDHAQAIQQYKTAMARYPGAAHRFPNAWYNTAESQFVLGRFREGLDSYRAFVQKFPDHEHGGYAMTRMGELLGILGADTERQVGAFRESFFRYRATPGAGIARIRILTSRMTEMRDKELADALREIEEITARYANRPKSEAKSDGKADAKVETAAKEPVKDGKDASAGGEREPASVKPGELVRLTPKEGEDPTRRKPELPGIEEFSMLLIADGFMARKDFDKAETNLIEYYQKNPVSPNKDRIKSRIIHNIAEGIRAAVERGAFIEGLRRFTKNSQGWLKNTTRTDICFNVGRAYELAGVFKEAATSYADCLKRLNSNAGSKEIRERNVFEHTPKADSLVLRMAVVEAKNGEFAAAEGQLKKIAKNAQLTDAEQIERAEVSAQVAEARGQGEAARKYLEELIAAWKGEPQLTSPLHLRIARLFANARNAKAADAHLAKIAAWKKQEGSRVSADIHAQALELRADLFVKRGKRGDAVKTYRELLATYEASRPLASVRYRLGQLLYQDGDLKGAETVWNELKPDKDNIWQRLAAEQMQGAKWQNEYKKYLDRIPAAADLRDAETAN